MVIVKKTSKIKLTTKIIKIYKKPVKIAKLKKFMKTYIRIVKEKVVK